MRFICLKGLVLSCAAASLMAQAQPAPSPRTNLWSGTAPANRGNVALPVAPTGTPGIASPSKAEVDSRLVMSPEAMLQRVKQRMAAVFAAHNAHLHTYVRLDLQTWRDEPQEFIALTHDADLRQSIRLYKPEHAVGEPLRTGDVSGKTSLPVTGAMFDPFDRSLAQLPLPQQVERLTQMWRQFKTEAYAKHRHVVLGPVPDMVEWRPSIKEKPTRILYVATPLANRGDKVSGPPRP